MSTPFSKINSFVASVANKVYNLSTDQLVVALTNTPNNSAWTKLSDLTEINYANVSSRVLTTTSSTQTAGVYKLILQNLTLTASGAVPTFRYIYIYDNTATNKDLICFYDYGSGVTLGNGDTFAIVFDAVNGVFQLT